MRAAYTTITVTTIAKDGTGVRACAAVTGEMLADSKARYDYVARLVNEAITIQLAELEKEKPNA